MDQAWQQQAVQLPQSIMQTMGADPYAGGLTLTEVHIRNLDQYTEFVMRLPETPAELVQWLGYANHREPELTPDRMGALFRRLQIHARNWTVLFEKNWQLTTALALAASEIDSVGALIVSKCEQSRALGRNREAWDAIALAAPVPLGQQDKAAVVSLVNYMAVLKESVARLSRRTNAVRTDAELFRDEARFRLIPAVRQKLLTIERQRAVEQSNPLYALISQVLKALGAALGRMQELAGQLQQLNMHLSAVVTSSSHLQSAWQTLAAYIDASDEKLQRITTGQGLARFIIYFEQFLGQWRFVEQRALEMNRLFSEFAKTRTK